MTWKPLRPPSSEREPDDLGMSLDRLGATLGVPSSRVLRTVFAGWDQIVGEALSTHAKPLSIRDGTLVVAVSDPTWATEVRWLAPDLLDKLSKAAGEPVATRVEARVTRSPGEVGAPVWRAQPGRMGPSSGSATRAGQNE